ncbi:MAG: hypothetical protein ABI306_06810 [Caulobacteraceae bacterium]
MGSIEPANALPRDRGYALVAAVTAVAAFAYIAFQVLAADRGQIVGMGARMEQARLEAAADAGLMLAVHALGDADPARRWSIDGRVRETDFEGTNLTLTVEDERGKAPLDGLNPSQARTLFEAAGASDERVDALVGELRDFQSGDEERAPDTPPTPGEPTPFPTPRQGGFRTVGDLMALKDMDASLFERIAPAVTVFFEESGPFVSDNAGALAKATMSAQEGVTTDELAQQGAVDEERPVEEIAPDVNLIGRAITVRAIARDGRGAKAHRMAIVELTGAAEQPYWIRYVE